MPMPTTDEYQQLEPHRGDGVNIHHLLFETLLTTRQVAERLGVSPTTVRRRHRSGELPGTRLASNTLFFREVTVERYLNRRPWLIVERCRWADTDTTPPFPEDHFRSLDSDERLRVYDRILFPPQRSW